MEGATEKDPRVVQALALVSKRRDCSEFRQVRRRPFRVGCWKLRADRSAISVYCTHTAAFACTMATLPIEKKCRGCFLQVRLFLSFAASNPHNAFAKTRWSLTKKRPAIKTLKTSTLANECTLNPLQSERTRRSCLFHHKPWRSRCHPLQCSRCISRMSATQRTSLNSATKTRRLSMIR